MGTRYLILGTHNSRILMNRITHYWTEGRKKPAISNGFLYFFGLSWIMNWRREQDSNPRTFRSTVFKTAAIDHSAIPPVVFGMLTRGWNPVNAPHVRPQDLRDDDAAVCLLVVFHHGDGRPSGRQSRTV